MSGDGGEDVDLEEALSKENLEQLMEESTDVFLSQCKNGNDMGIRALLRFSLPNLANACDKNGQSGLSLACSTGNVGVVRALVQSGSVDVNFPDNEGNTPLMMASQAGYDEVVRFFLFHMHGEVDVNAQNCSGFTALMKAALHGRSNCARLLIIGGADALKRDWGRSMRADQWACFCSMKDTATVIRNVAKCTLSKGDVDELQWERKRCGLPSGGHVTPEAANRNLPNTSRAPQTSTAAEVLQWIEAKIARAFKLKQKDRSAEAGAMYHLASSAYNMHSGLFVVNYPSNAAEIRRKEQEAATYSIHTVDDHASQDDRLVVTVTLPDRHPPKPPPTPPATRTPSDVTAEIPVVRLTHASPTAKRKPRRPPRDHTKLVVPKPVYKRKKTS